MIPKLLEMLAEDMTDRIGVKTIVATTPIEAAERLQQRDTSLPLIQLASITSPFTKQPTYELYLPNGTVIESYYDIDHIPAEESVEVCVAALTSQEVADIAFEIRSTYDGCTDAGNFPFKFDDNEAHVVAHYEAKQIRTPIEDNDSFFVTLIGMSDEGLRVPIPYPASDLRSSLSDQAALSRLLLAYYYYMHILESNVVATITNDYAELFRTKGASIQNKLNNKKKDFSKNVRKNPLATWLFGPIATGLFGSSKSSNINGSIKNIVNNFQAGTMNREEFETCFSSVLPVLPDLYWRAMNYEDIEQTLTDAQTRLSEVQQRADTIANALGIERNPEDNEYYQPRSLFAAKTYLEGFVTGKEVTMVEISEHYRSVAEEQAAAARAQQELIAGAIMAGVAKAIDETKSSAQKASSGSGGKQDAAGSIQKIRKGDSAYGNVVYTIADKYGNGELKAIKGDSIYGDVVYTIADKYGHGYLNVIKGDSVYGDVVYTIADKYGNGELKAIKGDSVYGDVVYTIADKYGHGYLNVIKGDSVYGDVAYTITDK